MKAPRISKPAPERRTEILDVARQLFITKGFQKTSIEDILKQVGIARGTLYYHFSSKEEILRALISRITEQIVESATEIAQQDGPAVYKFLAVISSSRIQDTERELTEQLHAPGNASFHILSITETVKHLTPILTEIVEQGIEEGTFHTQYPRETIEILLTSSGMLLDEGIFTDEAAEIPRRTAGIIHAAEVLLGCEPGTLQPIMEAPPC